MAPPTAQTAAFEKYGGTDTRPVMKREFLNVENDATAHDRH
jgi:hypothetical protein